MAKQKTRLLLLSDDESICRLFNDTFGGESSVCETVETSEAVTTRLMKRHYPILVLDLTSEQAQALKVVEFLQQNPGVQRPLIFALAHEAANLPAELDPRIVTMLIAKPFDEEDVQAVIRQTLASLTSVASEDTLRKLGETGRAESEPATDKTKKDKPEPEEEAPLLDVLVVDDDRTVQGLIVAALQREQLKAETAMDGAQAIGKLKKKRFCSIILDLMMPRLSGWQVIDWMRENPDLTPRSVIVSTAADRAVLHQLDPAIVNAIFVKPFNALELAAYVRACAGLGDRDRRSRRVIGAQPEIQR